MKFMTDHLCKFGYIGPEDFHFFKIMPNVAEAVREIVHFYGLYQSSRWVGEQLVVRLSKKLSNGAIADLNQKFSDILRTGQIVQGAALRQERTSARFGNCRGSSSRRIAAASAASVN